MCGHTHLGIASPDTHAAVTGMFVVTFLILPLSGEDLTYAATDAADAHLKTGEVRRSLPQDQTKGRRISVNTSREDER